MKNIIIVLTLLIHSSLFATEIDVATKVESVTIYHIGALIERSSSIQLKEGVNELLFQNLSGKIILNSLKFRNKEITILNKSIIKKLTDEEFNQLIDKKASLENQLSLLETKYLEPDFITKVDDLEKMMAFYSKNMSYIKKSIRAVNEQIVDAKKLDSIKLDHENAAILKVTVSIEKKIDLDLSLQYVVGSVGWSPSYEITVNHSSDKEIEIKYMARIMSQTGEDWNNVKISLSSSFPLESPATLPVPDEPWVLDGRSTRDLQQTAALQATKNENKQLELLEGVEYDEISIPSFLKLRTLEKNYSIKSNGTVFSFPITTNKIPAKYYYYGYPSIDQEVYLVAEIIDWETYGYVDGIAGISYNNNDIGKSNIKFSESKDTLLLPIGKDNSVYMKRQEIANQKYFKEATVSKKKVMTMAYEFVLKNNNDFPINFQLAEQIPISQTKSAEVEIETSSKGELNKETGEVTWNIKMKPGDAIDRRLIYNVEMGAHYSFGLTKSKKVNTVQYCPRFF